MKEFPNYFADAEESLSNSRFVIFGVPYDRTSSFRFGSRLAPREIRFASWNFESFDMLTEKDLSEIPVHDYGDLNVEDKDSKGMISEVSRFSENLIDKGKIPIAIGGEHTVNLGLIDKFDDAFILFLDAHMDFRDEYEDNKYNHACTLRRIVEKVDTENVLALGIRSAEKREFEEAKEHGLRFVTSKEIRSKGLEKILSELENNLEHEKIYLSLDFDVIDPAYAPGVSTPEPFGISPEDVIEMIKRFSNKIFGFDLVEVCPTYDMGITSILAAKIIRFAIAEIWKNNPYI